MSSRNRAPARKGKARGRNRPNSIAMLCSQLLANGTVKYHWKPSPRLRRLGYRNHDLGTDQAEAFRAAIALNEKVESDEQGNVPASATAPRHVTMADLLASYRASRDFLDLKPASKKLYSIYMARIEAWAENGRTNIAWIDQAAIGDYRETILNTSTSASASSHLRILRILFRWAFARMMIPENPCMNLDVKTPPPRQRILEMQAVQAMVDAAQALEWPEMALLIELALWTVQRGGDLRALPRTAWRTIEGIDPADRAVLAGRDGEVRGFRIQQQKTGTWVDCPVPPQFHDRIEQRLAHSNWLFTLPGADGAMQYGSFSNRFHDILARARKDAIRGGNAGMADQLHDVKFHDLRRSGMCFYGDLGVPVHLITALSGHAVIGRKTILDTYMPGHTRGAAAAVAMALRHLASREQRGRKPGRKSG